MNESLRNASLQRIHQYAPFLVNYLSVGLLNCVVCFLTINVLLRNKLLTGWTSIFLKSFFVNDFISSFLFVCFAGWHILNSVFEWDEVMTYPKCFMLASFQFFFSVNNHILTFMLSIDRLLSIVNPQIQTSQESKFCVIGVLSMPFLFSGGIMVASLADKFKEGYLVFCSVRESGGEYMTKPRWICLTVVSCLTVIVYCIMLVIATFKSPSSQVQPTGDQQNTDILLKRRKRAKKITRILATTAFVYFFIGVLPDVLSTLLSFWLPDMILQIGIYFGMFSFTEGTFYTMSMLFLDDFRKSLQKILKCGKSSSAVDTNGITHATAGIPMTTMNN